MASKKKTATSSHAPSTKGGTSARAAGATAVATPPRQHTPLAGSHLPKTAEFSVLDTLSGKTILIIGGTGFLGRIMLYHLLKFVPNIKRVFVLIRPTHGRTGADRMEQEVLGSPVFSTNPEDPAFFRQAVAEKVVVVEGDAARPGLALASDVSEEILANADVIINTAGNVDFNPPLDVSLSANTLGVRNVLDFCESSRSKRYVHISTCFVADRRVHRDSSPEEVVSNRIVGADGVERLIDPQSEIEAAMRDVEATRKAFDTPERDQEFLRRAKEELERMGRNTSDRMVERIAGNLKTFELREELIKVGRRRAEAINRPNVYTYGKALAEILTAERKDRIKFTILRPSIVETSLRHPFPGWNEGIQGSAPIIYLTYRGHRMIPSISRTPGERHDGMLDLVPVDLVAAGTLLATCALLRDEHKPVYQAAAGPLDAPMTLTRCTDLTMLTLRDRIMEEKRGPARWWKLNVNVRNVTKETFERFSTPRTIRMLEKARGRIDRWKEKLPAPAQEAAENASNNLRRYENLSRLKQRIFSEYLPFINHGYPIFENNNLKELARRLPLAERSLFPFAPHEINYSEYFRMHVDAIARWVFPVLEKRVNAVFRESGSGADKQPNWFKAQNWTELGTGERWKVVREEAGRRIKDLGEKLKTARQERREATDKPVEFVPDHLKRLLGPGVADLSTLRTEQANAVAAHFSFLTGTEISQQDIIQARTPARLERDMMRLLDNPAPSRSRLPADGLYLPDWAASPVKGACYQIQMQFYDNVLQAEISGTQNIPQTNKNVIVVANHSSHLDYGLVWYALGEYGKDMGILAARDYFFSNFWNSTFFRNFHNLIPFERDQAADAALKPALDFMQSGGPLLIFPEGTRSADGRMQPFRQGLGQLVQKTGADVLPAYLRDTHRSLPKGQAFWRVLRNRKVGIEFGKLITNAELNTLTDGMTPTKRGYTITKHLEQAVRSLSGTS